MKLMILVVLSVFLNVDKMYSSVCKNKVFLDTIIKREEIIQILKPLLKDRECTTNENGEITLIVDNKKIADSEIFQYKDTIYLVDTSRFFDNSCLIKHNKNIYKVINLPKGKLPAENEFYIYQGIKKGERVIMLYHRKSGIYYQYTFDTRKKNELILVKSAVI